MSADSRLLTRLALLVVLVLALAGCGDKLAKTAPTCAVVPQVVTVVKRVYVPIRAVLTAPEAIAEGPLPQCPAVAAERRAALERANAKLQGVAEVQGTEVKP